MFLAAPRSEGFQISTWYVIGACFWFPVDLSDLESFSQLLGAQQPAGRDRRRDQRLVCEHAHPALLRPARTWLLLLFHPEDHRPAHRQLRSLRVLGFWGLAILGGWTGYPEIHGRTASGVDARRRRRGGAAARHSRGDRGLESSPDHGGQAQHDPDAAPRCVSLSWARSAT